MRQPATLSRMIALNLDTRENIITWFTREFGFSRNAATALHDVQALKDAQALSELDNEALQMSARRLAKTLVNPLPRLP
jgi:hypothetical protein